jgi:hypothetical protein
LFWQDDFRQHEDPVYQDVSTVVNKSPVGKMSGRKQKSLHQAGFFKTDDSAQEGRFILQEVGCEAT